MASSSVEEVMSVLDGYSGEAEVLGNDRQCHGAIAPVRVVDGVEEVLMVGAPLRLLKTCIAAHDDPVDNGMDEGVHRGAFV